MSRDLHDVVRSRHHMNIAIFIHNASVSCIKVPRESREIALLESGRVVPQCCQCRWGQRQLDDNVSKLRWSELVEFVTGAVVLGIRENTNIISRQGHAGRALADSNWLDTGSMNIFQTLASTSDRGPRLGRPVVVDNRFAAND